MNGTEAIETTMAMEHTISASLNRQGNRFVQCLVFSRIDISVPPYDLLLAINFYCHRQAKALSKSLSISARA
jgi:hypothetical protein